MLSSTTRLSRPASRCLVHSAPSRLSSWPKYSLPRRYFHAQGGLSTLSTRKCNLTLQQRISLRNWTNVRFNSTNSPIQTVIKAAYRPEYMDEAEAAQIIQRAYENWPPPPPDVPVPEGWSCKWDDWPYLFIFYWFSPHYLMLPHIEMMLNIKYAIPGDARPILFYTPPEEQLKEASAEGKGSEPPDLFIFTVVERSNEFYFFDCTQGRLYRFTDPSLTETELVSRLSKDPILSSDALHYEPVTSSEEGTEILERIMKRDRTVIPDASKFLGYVPEHTEPWQENLEPLSQSELDQSSLTDEQIEEVQKLTQEIERRSPEFKQASEAWDRGARGEGESSSKDEGEVDLDVEKMFGLSSDLKELESVMREAEGELQKLQELAKQTKDNQETFTPEELLEIERQLDLGPVEELDLYDEDDAKPGDFKKLKAKDSLEVNEVDGDRVKVRVPYTSKNDS